MKRSEINRYIAETHAFFRSMHFALPACAAFTVRDWRRCAPRAREIFDLNLGWDITDLGKGRFASLGLTLFTIRNGLARAQRYPKPYAEKIMAVRVRQVTPLHFHWHKREDIINRGGGTLRITLYRATPEETLSRAPVTVSIDGIAHTVKAGGSIVLKQGESISLPPRLYHSFYARSKMTMVGEVSMVNDDANDNRFHEPMGRFPVIEEDEAPRYLLCTDYKYFIQGIA